MGSYRSAMVYRYFELPNTLYDVRVPRIATMSDAEIELRGLPVTTIDGKIEVRERDMVTVMLNLNRILDLYIEGYPIYLVNPNDIESIYKAYDNYIKNYNPNDDSSHIRLNRMASVENPDRLRELERFLNDMFEKYKRTIYNSELSIKPFDNDGFINMGVAATNNITIPGVDNSNNVYDDIKVGHMYDYSTAPQIDISKLQRQSYRNSRKV